MNIYEFAMNMEKEGESFYRKLAQRSEDPGIKSLMKTLAEEEVKHHEILEKLSRDVSAPELTGKNVLAEAKHIFDRIREEGDVINPNPSQADFCRKAREIEEQSFSYFTDKLSEITDEDKRRLVSSIIEDERQHIILLENLVEYYEAPAQWHENAEFNHLDEY